MAGAVINQGTSGRWSQTTLWAGSGPSGHDLWPRRSSPSRPAVSKEWAPGGPVAPHPARRGPHPLRAAAGRADGRGRADGEQRARTPSSGSASIAVTVRGVCPPCPPAWACRAIARLCLQHLTVEFQTLPPPTFPPPLGARLGPRHRPTPPPRRGGRRPPRHASAPPRPSNRDPRPGGARAPGGLRCPGAAARRRGARTGEQVTETRPQPLAKIQD